MKQGPFFSFFALVWYPSSYTYTVHSYRVLHLPPCEYFTEARAATHRACFSDAYSAHKLMMILLAKLHLAQDHIRDNIYSSHSHITNKNHQNTLHPLLPLFHSQPILRCHIPRQRSNTRLSRNIKHRNIRLPHPREPIPQLHRQQ